MGELRQEARAARAIARKELQVFARYRLNAVNQVIQPLYQTLIPGVLLGATFAIGGQAVGLAETAGTTDLVEWVAYLLPTTHALDLMRVAALGTRPLLPLPIEWLMLVVTSVALLVVGRAAWLRTEHRLRVQGTLGQH
jgi:hypothetical protein